MTKNDLETKPAKITDKCLKMLDKAVKYLRDIALVPEQAEIMNKQFFKTIRSLERMPGIGTNHIKGMRKFLLGKFPYYIYYKEYKDHITIRGIWHTSRGTEFSEN